MKHILLFLFTICTLGISAMAGAPEVPISKAATIAENSLKERQLEGRIYIDSITLTRSTLTSRKTYWLIKWNQSIPAMNPQNREIGMKVNMDGSYVRLVKE